MIYITGLPGWGPEMPDAISADWDVRPSDGQPTVLLTTAMDGALRPLFLPPDGARLLLRRLRELLDE